MRTILILFGLFCNTVSAQIPTNGLVAYYPFCGNADDFSGNNYHLTVSNATLTTDRFNFPAAAYSFNGMNSLLSYPTTLPMGAEYSFSCWFYANTAADAPIAYNGNTNLNGVGVLYSGGISTTGTQAAMLAGNVCVCMKKPASMSQWHHVVLTKDQTKYRLFVDNSLVDSTIATIFTPNGRFHLGMDYTNGTNPFNGKIDDVAFYNRALTAAEVSQLFNYQCTPATIPGPSPSTLTLSTNSTGTLVLSGTVGSYYQWQVNTGSGYVNLSNVAPFSGVNTNTLTITNPGISLNGALFRCLVTNFTCCTDTTDFSILSVSNASIICPTINNLPDTITACPNSIVQLQPTLTIGSGYTPNDTSWTPVQGLSNPNSLNPNVAVSTSPLMYHLTIKSVGNNAVINGNFNSGVTGFTSGYIAGTGGPWGPCSNPGTYGVSNDPATLHSLWATFGDHTSGTGNMLVINGAQTAGVSLWCQSVSVQPNTLYDFSTWLASVDATSPAQLQFAINGQPIGAVFNATAATGVWSQFHATWFSGTATTANICITNQNTAFVGNDFALDDIDFHTECEAIDSVLILPGRIVATINSPDTTCVGSPITFAGLPSGGTGTSYIWAFGDGGTSTLNPVSHSYTSTGNFNVRLFVKQSTCTDSIVKNIFVREPYDITVYDTICDNRTILFGGQTIAAPGTYTHTFKSTGYCDSTVHLNVAAGISPIADFTFTSEVNQPIRFTNTSVGADSYLWKFGDSSTSTEISPSHQYKTTGSYTVCLTAKSRQGCKNTKCKYIDAEVQIALDVPTAFSPNNDGNNDVLYVRGGGIESLNFKIYNRWGQVIFETNDIEKGWDGRYKGAEVDMDVVAYIVQATFIDGSTLQKQGNIAIIR